MAPRGKYASRTVDQELDSLMEGLPAIAIEGAKGVGKTATASMRATTVHDLEVAQERSVIAAEPSLIRGSEPPVLIDEWQRAPDTWNQVRRAVDEGAAPGSFLLTGSSALDSPDTHSGAGRIVTVRMRPMSLAERLPGAAAVSLASLLRGGRPKVSGRTELSLSDYVEEILASGFPGLRKLSGRNRRGMLDGYLNRVVDRDFRDLGHPIRNPATLLRWLTAYAAATSTTASYEKIRDAATAGQGDKPSRSSTLPYRDILERLWVLDPVPGWKPTRSRISRLTLPPKHHLADPALAARLLGVTAEALLKGRSAGPPMPRAGTLLGALFESLVTLSVRVYAQQAEARLGHMRSFAGEREVDLIVERDDGNVVALEVKLGDTVRDDDVRHLNWLSNQLGDELVDAAVINTGPAAYRRPDGIAVIPAALLGP